MCRSSCTFLKEKTKKLVRKKRGHDVHGKTFSAEREATKSARYHAKGIVPSRGVISGLFSAVTVVNIDCNSSLTNLLFRKIGMVVDPLHLEVCAVFPSSPSLPCSSASIFEEFTFPPLRKRRRFVPTGPGNPSFGVVMSTVAILEEEWWCW